MLCAIKQVLIIILIKFRLTQHSHTKVEATISWRKNWATSSESKSVSQNIINFLSMLTTIFQINFRAREHSKAHLTRKKRGTWNIPK